MKINWHYDISIKWFRVPVIPFISLTEIKPEAEKPVPKRGSWAILPVPEDAEAEILPIPAQTPATHKSDGRSYPLERKYDPDTRYRRGTGPLKGTERYRAAHVKRDLIQWFVDRQNRPLTETQMRTMNKSPFRHAWVKCEITCDHRIVSTSTLRRVLRNESTAKEQAEETPQVITFARTKNKKATFTLDKDFYKSLNKEIGTLNVPEYQLPTPPIQIPTETDPEESVTHADVVRAYVRENSDMRR